MTAEPRSALLESELRSYGIDVESVDDGAPLELVYMTAFPGRTVHHGEMGRACNALADLARDGGWEPVRVEATVERVPGDTLGTWRIEPEWIDGLVAGDLPETDFSARVLETLDHGEDDQDGGSKDRNDGEDRA